MSVSVAPVRVGLSIVRVGSLSSGGSSLTSFGGLLLGCHCVGVGVVGGWQGKGRKGWRVGRVEGGQRRAEERQRESEVDAEKGGMEWDGE